MNTLTTYMNFIRHVWLTMLLKLPVNENPMALYLGFLSGLEFISLKTNLMNRDGYTLSLWQDTTKESSIVGGSELTDEIFDVVIVGGGITGLTTAIQLQKAGKSVLVAEAHNIGFGTTGGTTAHINTFLESPYNEIISKFGEKNAQLVARAARQAHELVARNIEEYNIDCDFSEKQAWLFSQDEKQSKELDDIYEGSIKAGLNPIYDNSIPVKVPFEKAIVYPNQAQFHPLRYIVGIAKAFKEKGGIIWENCRVTAVDETQVLSITTSKGTIRANNLVYATHIPPGVNLLHFRCAPYRSYVLAAELNNENDYPDAMAYDMYDAYHYYRTQQVDGKKYFIVGGEDHKTGHEENTEACFLRLEAYLRNHYDVKEIAYRWSSQYFVPADGLAYIGHLPGHPHNMFVATGFGGNGMTYSHISALLLSDLIATGESEYRKLFDPNRIKPVAGFKNFVKEAADVVGKLVKAMVPKERLEELVELAPGEGRIVKYEGETIALYKDDDGNLHALSPDCTHINCTVGWNASEKTWDCPCHGSRYSADGEMLTAPARKDLQMINVEELVEHDDHHHAK
jgi:glycine/D-amino acid oxidase-like deaminating enzyme/nitrite reductase/ring-hydroxylating ferredoxin subunit